jgi:hypothetical protein
VFSGCDELITRPEESYRLWRVVCDLETTKVEVKSSLKGCEYKPTMGREAEREKKNEDVKRFSLRKEVFIITCRYRSATQPFLLHKY